MSVRVSGQVIVAELQGSQLAVDGTRQGHRHSRTHWIRGTQCAQQKIGGFQFRGIRPKAASEIVDIGDASLLLGRSKEEVTKRVYRRIGATAKPSK